MKENEGRMERKMEDKRGLNRNNESRSTEGGVNEGNGEEMQPQAVK